MNELLNGAVKILKTIDENGFEAYIVGGFVRDRVLGKNNVDIDITTSAKPETIIDMFEKTIHTGVKYGTVTVILNSNKYEVTTFRTEEGYDNNRHPDNVEFVANLEEDLKRRDFIMNSLIMDSNLNIIDYLGGKDDINNKVIRSIGEADIRFKEDALRMLRAIRFVSQLGFSIDTQTKDSIIKNKGLLNNVSNERIMVETKKIIDGEYFLDACKYLVETGVYNELAGMGKGFEMCLSNKIVPKSIDDFLAICVVQSGEEIFSEWKISNLKKEIIKSIAELHIISDGNWNSLFVYRFGKDTCIKANNLNVQFKNYEDKTEEIIELDRNLPARHICDLKFKGDHLIETYPNRIPGFWIRDILDDVMMKVLFNELKNDYDEIKNYVLSKY